MSIPQVFYVYVLVRPNGVPFYVGKGKDKRIFDHDKEARSGHKCYKCNVIRKIWKQGGEVQRYIVFTTIDESEAYAYERELISLHGRHNLTNLTDGGEGLRNPSKETREKIASALRGKPSLNKGKPVSAEMRARISATLKGRALPPHVYEQFKTVNIGRKYTQQRIDKIAMTQSGGRQYIAISPDGTKHEGIKSVGSFEKKHSLPKGALRAVIHGRATHCKGWVAWIEGQEPKPCPKACTIIAPSGARYEGILNVAAFAKEHGIDGHQLRAVLRGDRPHAQGWTGYREAR
jgi:hypothetical protein